jgi:glycosyltransferase involved in cell wall biosynthesis
MRVLVLAPYPLDRAPSQRFRWEQYIEPLRERGLVLEPSSFLDSRGLDVVHLSGAWPTKAAAAAAGIRRRLKDIVAARQYDLVIVHRESLPVGPAWVERLLRGLGVPYVFDFDDAIYLPAASEANRRLSWLKRAGKTAQAIRHSSLVLAGNQHLANWAHQHTARVVVIPTTIDTDSYRPIVRTTQAPLCVGWSGSPTTIVHLRLLNRVLRELQHERGIRLRVIGDASYTIDGAHVEALDWNASTEITDLSEIDIGIMPLPDDEWSRGKCGLKALQYMALGIPTVLSPVGVNRDIARDDAAILASTEKEWSDALRVLIDDHSLRARVAHAGRGRVVSDYSVKATLPRWERALRKATQPTDS